MKSLPLSKVKVRDIMITDVVTTLPSTTVRQLAQLMEQTRRAAILVTEQGRSVGIVTERDIVRRVVAMRRNPDHTNVRTIMSSPLITVSPDASVTAAAQLMTQHRIRRLPVTSGDRFIGILTTTDIARHLATNNTPLAAPLKPLLRACATHEWTYIPYHGLRELRLYRCSRCGAEKTETIPATS